MPEPVRSGQRYLPGLDGLRALAVLAVIAYHLGLGWAPGGLLGVGIFFTLSGYLITSLLLANREATGRLRLGDFWLRRARRLLPALAVMLAVVAAWVTLADRAQLAGLRGGTAAAAAYVSNWYLIGQHASYFTRFAPPSPLGHLWSLAVEEQFYLAWPWLLWLGLRWLPGPRGGPGARRAAAGGAGSPGSPPGYRWPAVATLALAAVSAIDMAVRYHAGYDPTRVYEGTDTRAFGLLIGAALALFFWPSLASGPLGPAVFPPRSAPSSPRSSVQTPERPFGSLGLEALLAPLVAPRPGRGHCAPGAERPLSRWLRGLSDSLGPGHTAPLPGSRSLMRTAARILGLLGLGRAAASRERLLLEGAGVAGLGMMGVLVWRAGEYDSWVYPGGMVLLSIATAAVVAAAACPATLVGRLLGWEPLRQLGVRSYGIYLWHFPVILLTGQAGGSDPARKAAQVALTVGVAALSWRYVEEPVRRGALGRFWARARNRARRSVPSGGRLRAAVTGMLPTGSPGWAALTAVVAVLAVGGAGLSGLVPASGAAGVMASGLVAGVPAGSGPGDSGQAGSGPGRGGRAGRPGTGGPGSAGHRPAWPGSAPRSACRAVAHIGDSTSEGMISPAYLPRAADRLRAQYARAGAATVRLGVSGARSVVETLPHQLNAYQVARRMLNHGFRGCWVLALGTNDTANVAAGSPVGRLARIERMMSLTGGQPVLWITVKTLQTAGPYAEAQMQLWNSALRQACARYPSMRIFDWAALARGSWFISDGVHYTSAGYAARARLIAGALARAFPARGHSAGCLVE
ncbi:MAG: acyltransferase family protein [Gemmatimonadota bacterium]